MSKKTYTVETPVHWRKIKYKHRKQNKPEEGGGIKLNKEKCIKNEGRRKHAGVQK